MNRPTYIHQQEGWPKLGFDATTLAGPLSEVRLRQGQLLGRIAALGGMVLVDQPELRLRTLTQEVMNTSEIEGERLPEAQVRSSVARRLGLPIGHPTPAGRNVEGIVEVLLDATQRHAAPLDEARLFAWHAALFPAGRSGMGPIRVGAWRDGPMLVVSGPMGRQRLHFEGPTPERLPGEIAVFLRWLDQGQQADPLLRAGLAQLWFLTIHPFEDGNGRVARAITELVLARSEGSAERFFSLSRRIHAERSDYYAALERAQRGSLDVTEWLAWFLGCLGRAIGDGEVALDAVLVKARFWAAHAAENLDERQRKVVNALLDGFEGTLTTSKVAAMNHVSTDTALRDLDALVTRGVLVRVGSGRGTHYLLR